MDGYRSRLASEQSPRHGEFCHDCKGPLSNGTSDNPHKAYQSYCGPCARARDERIRAHQIRVQGDLQRLGILYQDK